MPLARATWIFTGPGRSWTETLYIDSSAWGSGSVGQSLDAGLDFITNGGGITPKRSAMLGHLYGVAAVRLGFPETNVRALIRYQYLPGDQNHGSDDAEISMVNRCTTDDGQHIKYISTRGLWSNLAVNPDGTIGGTNGPAFQVAYNAWKALLENQGWSWRGVFATSVSLISLVGPDPQGRQVIEFAPDIPGISGTSPTAVQLSGIGGSKRLNGTQLVVRTAPGIVKTYFPFATFEYTTGGKIRYSTKTTRDIFLVRPQRIGSRDVGNSFKLSVGRRPATPKG